MTHRKTRSREGWTRVRFGDVVRLATERCADPLAAGIERYVGLEHLEPSDLCIRTWGNVADGVTFTNRFHAGQVLFGKRRAYQRKVAVADFDGVCSGDIYVFEPADDRLRPELLPFICQTEGFFEHALKTSAGSLSPRTNWKSLQEYEFDLPPVEEQRRIVSALSALDSYREQMHAVSHSLRRFLLSAGDDLVRNFADVPHRTIYEICDTDRPLCYGVVQPGESNGFIPFLRVCDINDDSEVADTSTLAQITKSVDDQYRRSRVAPGDVLVSIVGTIGRIAVVDSRHQGANIARALARISPIRSIMSPEFLAAVLTSPMFQSQLVRGSFETARKTLNLSELGQMRVPCPDLPMQLEAIARITTARAAYFATRDRLANGHQSLQRRFLPQACGIGA